MEKWFKFSAYNSQAIYGYGTEQEADAYCDRLNRNREINVYGAEEITDPDTLADFDAGKRDDGFNLADALDADRE